MSERARVKRSFTFSADDLKKLRIMAIRKGCTAQDLVERMVRAHVNRYWKKGQS